jgi:hypothetical protein
MKEQRNKRDCSLPDATVSERAPASCYLIIMLIALLRLEAHDGVVMIVPSGMWLLVVGGNNTLLRY